MRIAILTSLTEFDTSYSLVSVIQGQAESLVRYGHDVTLFTCNTFDPTTWEWCNVSSPDRFTIKPVIPYLYDRQCYLKPSALADSHRQFAQQLVEQLTHTLCHFDVVFTHDWIFTGWHMPHALALQAICPQLSRLPFYHWVHSIPNNRLEWWNLRLYGFNSKLVYPVDCDRAHVAGRFHCEQSDVIPIPHISDLRLLKYFHEQTCRIIDSFPKLLSADFVQVLPASSERLRGKGLDRVILAMAQLKKRKKLNGENYSVCLLCANQQTNRNNKIENLEWYKGIALRNGLMPDDFAFTSEWRKGTYRYGLPRRILFELEMFSNIFINPTVAESFGLALPEASLIGGVIPIQNDSLECQREVSGGIGHFVPFGAWNHPYQPGNERNFYNNLTDTILERFEDNESVRLATHYRQNHNMDAVYERYYAPLLWGQS